MAERRMFAKTIVLSDAFLDMPMSARCLYFTLGMVADDDGFVNSPRSIMRQIGASDDDIKLLIAKKFVLVFESGVIVIKHWRINNYLRNDRYKETNYTEEKSQLAINDNGSYSVSDERYTAGIPSMGIPSIGEDRKGKDSIGESTPTLEEVTAFASERKSPVDPKRFFSYYNESGWKDAHGNPVRNWKQKFISWENSEVSRNKPAKAQEWDDDKANEQLDRLLKKMEGG